MREKDKYMMREKGICYYVDKVLVRTPVGLKLYETFDGKEVKWGVKEDFISIFDDRLCLSTPQFENMIDKDGNDRERVIYLGDNRFVLLGKLNGNDVLCKLNKDSISENDFYQLEDFGGEDVHISFVDNKLLRVNYHKDDIEKVIFFDCTSFMPYSNEFDAVYDGGYFLKSYSINNDLYTKLYLGKVDSITGEVKPIGYDVCKEEFIDFPIDDQGLIDDKMILKRINTKSEPSIYTSFYKREVSRYGLNASLNDLEIDEYIIYELDKLNKSKAKRK